MKHVQHNYPGRVDVGLLAGVPHINGIDGRQYIRNGGSKGATRWQSVLQELKVCERCRRYIVIQAMKFVPIGLNRSDVEEYEARLQQQQRSLAGKKFRIKRPSLDAGSTAFPVEKTPAHRP